METKEKETVFTKGSIISAKAFKWVKKLWDKNPREREIAVAKLKMMDDPCAATEVVKKMSDKDPKVRMEVAHYFGKKCNETAIPVLNTLAKDNNPDVRGAAMLALGHYKGADRDTVLLLLKRGLSDEDSDPINAQEVKEAAIEALGRLGGEKAARILKLAIDDPDPHVREEALYWGSKTSMKIFQQLVIDALNDQDEKVRGAAKDILVEHMNKSTLLKLVRIYAQNSDESKIRKEIREIIVETSDSTALAYINALDHPTTYVQQHILASLEGKAKTLPPLLNGEDKKEEIVP